MKEVSRARYSAELRAALAEILEPREEVTLEEVERLLPDLFSHAIPGRVALAKGIVGFGWFKSMQRGQPTRYCRPRAAAGDR